MEKRWLGLVASLGVHLLLVLPPVVPDAAPRSPPTPDVHPDELVWLEQTASPTQFDAETKAAAAGPEEEQARTGSASAEPRAPSTPRKFSRMEQPRRENQALRLSPTAGSSEASPTPPGPRQDGQLPTAGGETKAGANGAHTGAEKSAALRAPPKIEVPALDLSPANVALLALRNETCLDGFDAGVADATSSVFSARAKARSSQRTLRKLARTAQAPADNGAPGPALSARLGGGYSYESEVLKAEINKEGEVRFGVKRADKWIVTPFAIFGVFRFDGIPDKVAGNDLQTSEKRWFLDRTSELREFLISQAREERLEAARLRLLAKLARIAQADYLTLADKHEAIFALWDDCSPDGIGEQGQLVIEEFVRGEMPEGGESAFSTDELLAFNARRLGPRPFAPYGDAG